jgi:hypothetical protein
LYSLGGCSSAPVAASSRSVVAEVPSMASDATLALTSAGRPRRREKSAEDQASPRCAGSSLAYGVLVAASVWPSASTTKQRAPLVPKSTPQ